MDQASGEMFWALDEMLWAWVNPRIRATTGGLF